MNLEAGSALVTGEASGLGLTVAQRLQERCAQVVVVDLPRSAGDQVTSESGARLLVEPGDVRDPTDVKQAVRTATRSAPLRVTVVAAGVLPVAWPSDRAEDGDHERVRLTSDVDPPGTYDVLVHAAVALSADEEVDGGRDAVVCTAAAQVPHPARLGSPSEFAALVEHVVDPMPDGEVVRLDDAVRLVPR